MVLSADRRAACDDEEVRVFERVAPPRMDYAPGTPEEDDVLLQYMGKTTLVEVSDEDFQAQVQAAREADRRRREGLVGFRSRTPDGVIEEHQTINQAQRRVLGPNCKFWSIVNESLFRQGYYRFSNGATVWSTAMEVPDWVRGEGEPPRAPVVLKRGRPTWTYMDGVRELHVSVTAAMDHMGRRGTDALYVKLAGTGGHRFKDGTALWHDGAEPPAGVGE
jgi:hypothetical protein